MAVNSYKDDEKLTEKSKAVTLKRLFSYLLAYKWQILLVLVLMYSGTVPPDGDRAHLKPVCGACDEGAYVYHGKGL